MTKRNFSSLAKKLDYRFKNPSLLEEALRHSSFVNEQQGKNLADNERLEFLGDAVLNLAVGHLLMKHYPALNEGSLSRMRSNLVNETKLGDIARALNIGGLIQLGKGEMNSNGFEKQSILADTFEALTAAIYLDAGYDKAFSIIEQLFKTQLDTLDDPWALSDYKSRLQEIIQLKQIPMPVYEIIREFGPDHDKTFVVKLKVNDIVAEGIGKNKKTAEQDAAQKAVEMLSPPQPR
ncbi:MAG: ribonuclease III [Proteobacteria bacterium]|nr:ribonuclease III [Pseudomonadota bacterium]MBU4469152.1 ribonuclease III [Pseudomonadota bacterium]MCG2752183.1 ribonuclease III [Desulfobacteraceae bacterium]